MKSQIAQTLKGPIEYTRLGSRPAVLVCHGTSSNCFSIELADPLMEAGFNVLTPSRPGYGRTPLKVGLSAAQAAEALVTYLDSLQIPSCAVIGISGGGPTGALNAWKTCWQILKKKPLVISEMRMAVKDKENAKL
jgi:pimeloyl-ACP methyl ester carboxylesterase